MKITSKAKRVRGWPPESVLKPGTGFKWRPQVVFDLHNTLVDFNQPFSRYVEATLGLKVDFGRSKFYDWAHDPSLSLTTDQFHDAIAGFSQIARNGGYGDLPVLDGAVETLQEIKDAGIRPLIWTWTPGVGDRWLGRSMSNHTGIAQERTIALIERLGFPIDTSRDLLFISPSQKVEEMLNRHIPLIVEDSPLTAVAAASSSLAAMLVPQTYNSLIRCRNLIRLNKFSQVAPTVIEFFEQLNEASVLLNSKR